MTSEAGGRLGGLLLAALALSGATAATPAAPERFCLGTLAGAAG